MAYSFESIDVGILDQSGYMIDLVTTGGATVSGHTGSGMDCSAGGATGVDLSAPMETAVALNSASVMMWVKSNPGAAGTQVLFHVGGGNTDDSSHVTVYASNAGGMLAVTWGARSATTTTSILDGLWHFVSVQHDSDVSTGLVIKVDDAVVYTDPAAGTFIALPSGAFAIGQMCGGALPFDGVIDDFRGINDPIDSVSLGTSNAVFMADPVRNLLELEYGCDASSGTVLADTSGYGRDATLASPSWAPAGGKYAGALDIGGHRTANDPIGTVAANFIDASRWAFLFWFNGAADATSEVYTIIEVRDAADNVRAEMLVQPNQGGWNVYPRIYDTAFNQWISSPNFGIPPDGAWHHVAFTIFPQGWLSLLDGVEVGSASGLPLMTFPNWDVVNVGAGRFAGPVDGMIDDVRILSNYMYDGAVQKHMAHATTPAEQPASAGALHVGSATPSAIYAGAAPVDALYVGEVQIYP